MDNQIIIKGRVCNIKKSDGNKPQTFGLIVSTGKIKKTGEWAKGFIYNIVDWNNFAIQDKQTIIVDGFFESYLANDGTERNQINAKKIMIPPPKDTAPNWGANDDVPF
jgi:hypothetical protein